jgi:uncharacterized protein YycO
MTSNFFRYHLLFIVALICGVHFSSCSSEPQASKASLRNGDIIFHASKSEQSKAIQLATGSEYSHCGIVCIEAGKTYVVEAVQPVKRTPFDEFVKRGEGGEYVVKRLRNAEAILTDQVLQQMKSEGQKMIGKNYDSHFNWSDDQIYCSELVWKIYQRATGIELGEVKKMKDFDFSNRIVKEILHKRYKDEIPWEEPVISPADIFESKELVVVGS